jgi:hypothetical protein
MPDQKIGQLLDSLGVSLVKAASESLDWVTTLGMLTAALEIENSGYVNSRDDGE